MPLFLYLPALIGEAHDHGLLVAAQRAAAGAHEDIRMHFPALLLEFVMGCGCHSLFPIEEGGADPEWQHIWARCSMYSALWAHAGRALTQAAVARAGTPWQAHTTAHAADPALAGVLVPAHTATAYARHTGETLVSPTGALQVAWDANLAASALRAAATGAWPFTR
jgi:hypothetical protein